jgi:hypothetical protein
VEDVFWDEWGRVEASFQTEKSEEASREFSSSSGRAGKKSIPVILSNLSTLTYSQSPKILSFLTQCYGFLLKFFAIKSVSPINASNVIYCMIYTLESKIREAKLVYPKLPTSFLI